MESQKLDLWASVLNSARINAKPIAQISLTLGADAKDFSRSAAYSIQEKQLQTRLIVGEKQVGWKMGLTSEAKRKQMNLDSPLYGFLTDQMQVRNGESFSLTGKIHPKIEPEIAFWLKHELSGKVNREQVLSACGGICACLEILDSRYEQFKYFSMEDVISDNSSSADFVLGPWLEDFRSLDLLNLKMEMFADGKVSQSGISSDISGDPVVSVIQLCEMLAERGQTLKAGSIVLAGAATLAIPLNPGLLVELCIEGLKSVSVTVMAEGKK